MYNPLKDRLWLMSGAYLVAGCVVGNLLSSAGAGTAAVWVCVALFVLLGLGALLLRRMRSAYLLRAACLIFGVLWICLRLNAYESQTDYEGMISGRICAYPAEGSGGQAMLVLSDVELLDDGGRVVPGKVRVYLPQGSYQYGDTVVLQVSLEQPSPRRNPGTSDARESLYARGIVLSGGGEAPLQVHRPAGSVNRAILSVRSYVERGVRENCDEEQAAMLIGMLFGDTSDMTYEQLEAFRATGTAHVLAVSGLHVGILARLVAFAFQKLFRNRRWVILALTGGFLYCYAVMAGFSVSVLRASFMTLYGLFDDARGELRDPLDGLGFAASMQIVLNPCAVFGASFVLSYGAVLGILSIGQRMIRRFEGLREEKPRLFAVLSALAVSASAQLGILPATIWYFGRLPVFSLVWNLLLVPLSGIILPLVLFGCILGAAAPLAFVAGTLASVMMSAARFGASLPLAQFSTGRIPLLALLALVLVLFGLTEWVEKRMVRRTLFGAGAALAAAAVVAAVFSEKELRITMLDVGQSEAIVIESEGHTLLIDGGMRSEYTDRGAYVVLPYLRYRGIDLLDAVLVTHNDSDHIGGLVTVAQNMEIDQAYLGNLTEGSQLPDFLDALGDTMVTCLRAGDRFSLGDAAFTVLWPETQTEGNEGSVVLLMEYEGVRVLFTGDIGAEVEEQLSGEWMDVDVLKVAHHGSKYGTTEEMLALTLPEYALISAGEDNIYGFPAPELMQRLSDANSDVLVTAECGAITLHIRDGNIQIETMLPR